jgi:hypothetical protein
MNYTLSYIYSQELNQEPHLFSSCLANVSAGVVHSLSSVLFELRKSEALKRRKQMRK